MSAAQIFISYSRANADFAEQLASDLRRCKANIWFDTFSIRAGTRWDAEIQSALKSADTFLIILSPESVMSDNVMDELSYALDRGKRIIPVLMAECDLPFRISRLQYIDFSANYEKGLDELLLALSMRRSAASGVSAIVPKKAVQPKAIQRKAGLSKNKKSDGQNAGDKQTQPEAGKGDRNISQESGKSHHARSWIVTVVLVAAVGYGLYYNDEQKKEKMRALENTLISTFKSAQYADALRAAQAYADLVPDSRMKYALLARGKAGIMTGIGQQNEKLVRTGLQDLSRVDASEKALFAESHYFSAIGHIKLGEYRQTVEQLNLIIGNESLPSWSYEEIDGYRVHNLRGFALLQLKQHENACADFLAGVNQRDGHARDNYDKYCRVRGVQLSLPSVQKQQHTVLEGLKLK